MGLMGKEELNDLASKKALEFTERFIRAKGSTMSSSGALRFDNDRPALEGAYACGYLMGYADALGDVAEEMK